MSEPTVIKVLAHRRAEAVEMLTKLAKKANRFGSEPITFTVGAVRTESRQYESHDGEVRSFKVKVQEISVSGSAPTVGKFQFVAALEHEAAGNMIRGVPDSDIQVDPKFRHAASACEHCGLKRSRNETYVVANTETGQQVQVGSDCLKDYLGVDPAQAIAKFNFMAAFGGDFEEEFHGLRSFHWSQTLEFMLSATATMIRIDGWLSRGEAYKRDAGNSATADRVATLWARNPSADDKAMIKRFQEKQKPEDNELAKKVIAWIRSDDTKANSDYMHNLKVACADDWVVEPKRVGLVCSAVAAYNRAIERETQKRAELQSRANSKYVGEIGVRLRNVKATMLMAKGLGEGPYGYSTLFKFLTTDGDVLTWISTSCVEISAGRAVILTGTVKAHKEYAGCKETRMSRVKVEEVEDANHRVGAAA